MPTGSTASLQVDPPATPFPALNDLLQQQARIIVPSQQALQTFWECNLESSMAITQTKQLSTLSTQIADSPHPTTFTSNLVQHEVEPPAPSPPSPLNPVHDLLEVNGASLPTAWSKSDEYSTNGDTHSSHLGSQSLSPKVKKHAKSHKRSPQPKSRYPPSFKLSLAKQEAVLLRKTIQMACFFCRSRKIACGQPLPGDPNRTCK